MPEVSRLQGDVSITGLDQAVTGLTTLASVFDKAGTSSTNALRQINQFGSLAQDTRTAATGVNTLAAANQQYTQAARARITVDDQLEKAQLRLKLAQTDAPGRVSILRQQYEQLAAAARPLILSQDELTKRTLASTQAAIQLANAERSVAREQQSQLQAAAGGFGRGVLQGVGAGGILGGLGIAGGVAVATRELIDLGKASTDLAIRAETIGTAYEAATKRAGFASDDLLKKLSAAARGTVADAELQASANKALALGVGQNATQIADLLAIARQKGKDFGEGTAQAFEDITVGLGRLSPRILDNLGIILDENKIYQEYARSIGVAEGKLSDQEKRQALVNELLRTNTDLIAKNATANLDAADKIARSQATIDQAKARIGAALLPGVAAAADVGATFIESLTGGISARADALNRQLAAQATSAEDYVKRYNAAVRQLNPSGQTRSGTTDELTGQYLALQQLSAAEANEIRLHALDDAGRRESIQTYRESTQAIKDNAQAAALTKDDYDRLGASLSILTDRGLRPYKAAVDDAKISLDAHKASTQAAKDAVDAISTSLSAAKSRFQEFAQAQLAGTKAYADQQFALDQQSAKIQRDFLNFKAPGAGLDQLLAPIQSQIDAADASLKGYASDLDEINSFVADQTRTVKDAEAAQKSYDDAVGSAKDNLDAQQSRLEALQGVYDTLGESIKAAKRDMDDLRHTSLVGEGALDDKLFSMEQNIKRQQLVIDQARLRGAGKDEIKKLTEQLDKLRTAEDAARLAGELRYDKQHRALEQQGVPRDEKTYAEASAAIADNQGKLDDLTKAQQTAGDAVKQQQDRINQAKWDLLDATAVQRDHTAAVDAEKAALDKLKETQTTISQQYQDQKSRLADLKQQLDTTRTDALKPFQDQIDELGRRAAVLKLSEKLELDPLRRKIEETAKPIREMTFAEIIAGLTSTNTQIGILQGKLDNAKTLLQTEQDATKVAQGNYDTATKALEAQQKYFDNLKIGLQDLKDRLTESKDIWGDLSTLIGAINSANGTGNVGGIPGQRAPFFGATGSGAYNVDAINKILSATGLNGQGGVIAGLATQTGVPAALALAMLQHESSFGSMGASVANNNPGNLKYTDTTAGYGGTPGTAASDGGVFAHFKSIQDGIAAYFHLLQDVYGKFIANGDIAGLIGKYAPSSSNDTTGYIAIVQKLIAQYAAAIVQKAATGQGPLAAAEAALGIPGAQKTQDYIRPDGSLHGGIDLAGLPAGTPIHALEGGRVVLSKWSDLYGNMIEVANAATGKLEEYYGHLQDRLVKVGDLITAGTVIGTLGGTGSESTGVHLHLQLYDENGNLTDPMTELAKMFGTGKGPTEAQLQTLLTYLNGLRDINGAMTDLGPNLPVLAGQIAGVGDAAAAAAAGIDTATTAMVNATDDILQHATYKNRDGNSNLAYLNQNGGLSGAGNWTKKPGDGMSVGGPHFGAPIATPPERMKGNDPTQDAIASVGAAVMGLQDTTANTFDGIAKLAPGWKDTWAQFGQATIAEMDGAQRFMEGATLNIVGYVSTAEQRIDDLIGKILSIPGIHVSTGPSKSDPGGVNDPGQPGGPPAPPAAPGPARYSTITINTRDSDRAVRHLRQMGY